MLHEIKHVQVGTSTDPINETKIACKKVYFSAWDSMECHAFWSECLKSSINISNCYEND